MQSKDPTRPKWSQLRRTERVRFRGVPRFLIRISWQFAFLLLFLQPTRRPSLFFPFSLSCLFLPLPLPPSSLSRLPPKTVPWEGIGKLGDSKRFRVSVSKTQRQKGRLSHFCCCCTTRSFSTVLDFLLISFATLMKTTSWEGLGRGRERTDGKGGEKRVGSSCSEVDRGTGERGWMGKKSPWLPRTSGRASSHFRNVFAAEGVYKKPREAM